MSKYNQLWQYISNKLDLPNLKQKPSSNDSKKAVKMRQIPINQARSILKQLLKARNHQKVRLLTNKKDRSLTVIVNNGE